MLLCPRALSQLAQGLYFPLPHPKYSTVDSAIPRVPGNTPTTSPGRADIIGDITECCLVFINRTHYAKQDSFFATLPHANSYILKKEIHSYRLALLPHSKMVPGSNPGLVEGVSVLCSPLVPVVACWLCDSLVTCSGYTPPPPLAVAHPEPLKG